MPMYILHDVYLEDEGLSAQIDYLVFTRKICFVMKINNPLIKLKEAWIKKFRISII